MTVLNGSAMELLSCCLDGEAARYFVDMMAGCEPMYRYAAGFVDDTTRVSIKYLLIKSMEVKILKKMLIFAQVVN